MIGLDLPGVEVFGIVLGCLGQRKLIVWTTAKIGDLRACGASLTDLSAVTRAVSTVGTPLQW
jgi:hypothetical protein